MNKFHNIPTDQFEPLSHENSYLFTHYEKISTFLAFSFDVNYIKVLGKPVQQGYSIEWFSSYDRLQRISELTEEESKKVLTIYWEFIEKVNAKVQELGGSNDENNKNWASLLSKAFNHQNNQIFSNGNDICIVWGWKFNNNELYKPNLISQTPKAFEDTAENIADRIPNPHIGSETLPGDFAEEIEETTPAVEPELPVDTIESNVSEENDESGFVKFLKWFASRFWWLLWVLLLVIILILLFKSCDSAAYCEDVNSRVIQLENKANNCLN